MSGCGDYSGQPPLRNFPAMQHQFSWVMTHTRVKIWITSDSANHPVPRDLVVQIQCMPHLTCEASSACEVCTTLQPIFCDCLSGTISPNLVSVTTAQIDLLHSFAAYTPMSSNSAIPFKPITIPKRGRLNCLFLVLHLRQKVMIEWGLPLGLDRAST